VFLTIPHLSKQTCSARFRSPDRRTISPTTGWLPQTEPLFCVDEIRWDENAGLRWDAISSQVIDALEAQGDKGGRHSHPI
jgi:hypothetical protein